MWTLSIPIVATETSGFPALLTPLDFTAALLWTLGILFESVADLQLTLFKTDKSKRGKILTTGLWKYSRHPNYFGEAVVWWGFYVIALAAGFWWTIFSPVLMFLLLTNISGVAMLEQSMTAKPGYREYMERTSAFVPWFPKK